MLMVNEWTPDLLWLYVVSSEPIIIQCPGQSIWRKAVQVKNIHIFQKFYDQEKNNFNLSQVNGDVHSYFNNWMQLPTFYPIQCNVEDDNCLKDDIALQIELENRQNICLFSAYDILPFRLVTSKKLPPPYAVFLAEGSVSKSDFHCRSFSLSNIARWHFSMQCNEMIHTAIFSIVL